MAGRKERGYTHFVGVLVPPPLAATVEGCRAWMADRYGCASGYRTEPHVTLVAPFAIEDAEGPLRLLEGTLAQWTGTQRPFTARVRGFGAFANRTIFARVEEDGLWTAWQRGAAGSIAKAFPGLLPADRRTFTPHLTVANRDIPETAFMDALVYFAGLELDEVFPVDHVVLFERKADRWEVRAGWKAGTLLE